MTMNTATTKTLQHVMVYGSLIGCVATLAWFGRVGGSLSPAHALQASAPAPSSHAELGSPPASAHHTVEITDGSVTGYYTGPLNASHRLSRVDATDGGRGTVAWQEGNPALQRRIDVEMTDLTISQAVAQIAKKTGLNLVCFDGLRRGRVSLQLSRVPLWQAMEAVAQSCGGSWERSNNLYLLRVPQTALSSETLRTPKAPVRAPGI